MSATPSSPAQADDGAPEDPRVRRRRLARRVIGFDDAVLNAVASEVIRIPEGLARISRDVPLVYGLSGLHLDRPVAVTEARGLIDTHLRGLPAARVTTNNPEVAWALGHGLQERGFTQKALVFMVHDPAEAPAVSPLGFEVVDAAGYSPALHAITAEYPWGSPEVCREMDVRAKRLQDRAGAVFIVDRDRTAACHVYRRGMIAQIEEVGVLTEARGRGLGLGVIVAALRECHAADTVFLVADAEDWPRRWYRRLGFTEVASSWEWMRSEDSRGDAG